MKALKIILATLLVLFVGAMTSLYSQSLQATTYVEQTMVSPKLGTSIGVVFNNQIEVGGFYQQSAITLEAEAGRPLMSEQEFFGAYVSYPLVSNHKVDLKFNVRTGVSNGENFAITPSVRGDYKVAKRIAVTAGVGVRSFRPTAIAGLTIKL